MIVNPEILQALSELEDEHGGELQPQDVVDAARDVESPLHSQFEWDDTEAGEKWRRHQARQLIRAVVHMQPAKDGSLVPVRVYASLTPDRVERNGYRRIVAIMANPDQRRQLLLDARAEMRLFQEKYRSLNELSAVFVAMKEADHAIDDPVEELSAST